MFKNYVVITLAAYFLVHYKTLQKTTNCQVCLLFDFHLSNQLSIISEKGVPLAVLGKAANPGDF